MNIRRTISTERLAFALAVLMAPALHAQPTCSINIGADTVICQGETASLTGPPGYSNYLWSTGAQTQNISVSTAGDHWCQVSYPSGNLVTNGDFSSGNTGFTSQYTYSLTNVQNEGYYTVGPNAHLYHTQFQGTGNGNFLIGNAGYGSWSNGVFDVWCQTIPCCPGQTYTLSFLAQTLSNALPARAVWNMDGVLAAWPDMTFPAYGAGWQQYNTSWTAGPGQTSVTACITITSGDGVGDDFGIDNISISGTIVLRDTVHVSVTPLPNVDLGTDFALCNGETTDLDATVLGGTYLWQDGSTDPGYHVTSPGNYSVTVTANNCSNTDNVSIAYDPLPVVQLGPDTMLCAGSTLSLSVLAPGSTYLWQDGSTASSFMVGAPGLYWAEVTRNNCSARDSISIIYRPLPVVSLGNDTVICAGSPLTLDASVAGATYQWQDGSTGSTFPVASSGNYQVTVDLNGCTAQDAMQVSVDPVPVADIGLDTTVCPGSTVTFDATTPNASYLWSDGTTGPTLTTAVPSSYSVQVTVNGCSSSDAATLSNFSLQSVSLGPDRMICAGGSVMIGASVPGATYLWSTGAATDSVQASAAGTYWVDATLNGCPVRDSINVSVTPLPVVDLGVDQQVCPGVQTTLGATLPGGTYLWSNGAVIPTITVGAGSWSVDVTVDGCTDSDTVIITNLTPPVVDLGPDQVICPGTSATFDATTPNATYLWSDGTTGATLITDVIGVYSVQVTVNGCSASDAAMLSNFNLQSVGLGPDRTICAGETATVGVHVPGATYLWNTGAGTDSIPVTAAGTYWVDALLNGCAVRDSIDVSVTPLPVVDIGPDQQVCPGAQATLDATLAGGTYLWSNGGTSPTVTVGVGTWTVDVTVNGCTASDAVAITNLTPPIVDLGPDTALCPNTSITLNAGPYGTNYLWNTGATGPSITVSSAITASVTVIDAQGCSGSDVITISYATPVPVSLGPDIIVCAGEQVTLDATTAGASGYLWSDGTTGAILTTINAGTYIVSVSQGNCATGDTITVQTVPAPAITLGNDTTLCPGETLNLHASNAGATFVWQDGSSGNDLLVQAAGGYWVAATNSAGCTDTAFVQVGYLNSDAFDLGPDSMLCSGSTLLLDAGLPGGTTTWSGAINTTSASVQADQPGTYIATTTVTGCSFTDSIHISVVSPPAVDLGADQSLCTGSTVQLTATAPSLLWDDGSTANTRTIHQGGTYWVQATDNGCSATDTVTVIEVPLPVLDLGPDTGLCLYGFLQLDATVPDGSYLWNDGSTAPQRTVGPGEWAVQVSAQGCSTSDTVQVDALPSPVLFFPADTTLCTGAAWTIDAAQPGSTYLWSTGAVTPSLTIGAPGTYSVTVDRGGCIASAQVDVAYMDLSAFSIGPDSMLCPGATMQLSVDVPGASVVWQDGSMDLQRSVNTEGTYQANISVGGCTAQASMHLGITPLPEADLGGDRSLCAGDTLWLKVQLGVAHVEWSTGASTDSLRVTTSGNYSVSFALDGCISTDMAQITFLPVHNTLDLGPDEGICPGRPITLDATIPGAYYTWNDGSHQPALQIQGPGTYHVTLTGPCIHATDTITFTEGVCVPVVHVPNAFTPDGDDINDLFTPVVFEPVRQWSFMIFDRWGERIFSTDLPGDGWDGTVNGKEAPVGVYVWDLHFESVTDEGVVQEGKRGSVTLVR